MKTVGITSTAILALLLGVAAPAYAQHEEQGDRPDHGKQPGGHEQGQGEPHGQPQQQQQRDQHSPQPHPQPQRQNDQHNQQQGTQQPRPNDHNQQQHAQQQQQQYQHDQQQHAQQQQQQHQHDQQQHVQQQQQQQYQHDQQQHAQERQRQAQPNQQHNQQQQRVQHAAWQEHQSQNWQHDHRTCQQRGGYRGYRIPDDRYRGYFGPGHGFRINTHPFLVVGGYPLFQYQGYWISAVDPWPAYWGNDWYDNDDVYVNYVDNGYYLYNRRYPSSGIAINITL